MRIGRRVVIATSFYHCRGRGGLAQAGERSAREVIEARRVVEVELAGLAAARATDLEVSAIAEKLALMQASLHDADAFARYDLEFHLAVARAAHNQVLYHVLDTLRHVLRAWFVEVFPRRSDKTEPIRNPEAGEDTKIDYLLNQLQIRLREHKELAPKEDRLMLRGSIGLKWSDAMQVLDTCRKYKDKANDRYVDLFPKVEMDLIRGGGP